MCVLLTFFYEIKNLPCLPLSSCRRVLSRPRPRPPVVVVIRIPSRPCFALRRVPVVVRNTTFVLPPIQIRELLPL